MPKTLDIEGLLSPDRIGTEVANKYLAWDSFKSPRKAAWEEIQRYIYSTDTTTTSNSKLPWKNKTTLPKLCQIRDNLNANYQASLFPKADNIEWQADVSNDQTKAKAKVLENFCVYTLNQAENTETLYKLILDYIDYGNAFVTTEWYDGTVRYKNGVQSENYIGPRLRRISPYDIVFNPTAPSFKESPKIIRSVVTIGELRKQLNSITPGDNIEETQKAFECLRDLRNTVGSHPGDFSERDAMYRVDGFGSFREYLGSSYVELLTFYGDFYDVANDELYENYIITVADRHKVLGMRPNDSIFGYASIHHIGWRTRQDNLWAMGPLENLVGMQYRIDHVENLKADVFDLIAAPPLMIKGHVTDFEWAPFAKIYVGDDGDVKVFAPEGNVLSANMEVDNLEKKMEEYAGSPKEAAGFRTPGEKTAYEVQRLENAASRIFYSKTKQFEQFLIEPSLNDFVELGRRKLTGQLVLRVFDDETNATIFQEVEPKDLAGLGRIRPMAARNFAEKAERVQNVNAFFSSVIGQDQEIKAHFSTINLARMFEELLDIEEYQVVRPYVRLFEQQQAQKYVNAGQEDIAMDAETPAGISPDDFDA